MIAKLEIPGYNAKIERAVILRVEAIDWNCPQHITPRYTAEEIQTMIKPLYEQIEKLETEIRLLKSEKDEK